MYLHGEPSSSRVRYFHLGSSAFGGLHCLVARLIFVFVSLLFVQVGSLFRVVSRQSRREYCFFLFVTQRGSCVVIGLYIKSTCSRATVFLYQVIVCLFRSGDGQVGYFHNSHRSFSSGGKDFFYVYRGNFLRGVLSSVSQ